MLFLSTIQSIMERKRRQCFFFKFSAHVIERVPGCCILPRLHVFTDKVIEKSFPSITLLQNISLVFSDNLIPLRDLQASTRKVVGCSHYELF